MKPLCRAFLLTVSISLAVLFVVLVILSASDDRRHVGASTKTHTHTLADVYATEHAATQAPGSAVATAVSVAHQTRETAPPDGELVKSGEPDNPDRRNDTDVPEATVGCARVGAGYSCKCGSPDVPWMTRVKTCCGAGATLTHIWMSLTVLLNFTTPVVPVCSEMYTDAMDPWVVIHDLVNVSVHARNTPGINDISVALSGGHATVRFSTKTVLFTPRDNMPLTLAVPEDELQAAVLNARVNVTIRCLEASGASQAPPTRYNETLTVTVDGTCTTSVQVMLWFHDSCDAYRAGYMKPALVGIWGSDSRSLPSFPPPSPQPSEKTVHCPGHKR